MSNSISDEVLQHYPLSPRLANLPKGWAQVWLIDIADEINPGFASGEHSADKRGVAHLRPMNIDRDGKVDLEKVKYVAGNNETTLSPGDVLFNNTNSPELIGKTALITTRENGFAFSNHMTRIHPALGIESRYLSLQLHFLWMSGYSRHRCTNHVNQASISSKTLANFIPFLLPPAAEQTRVVAKLEELLSDLDAGVAELKAAQRKLTQYRQALLKAAVEGALTVEWRAQNQPKETGAQLLDRILKQRRTRWETKQLAKFKEQGKTPHKDWQAKYPEPVKPDTTDLPSLPEGWVWASIDQLTADQKYGSSAKTDSDSTGIPVLRMGNIQDGELDLSSLKYLPRNHDEFPELLLKDGDMLFNRTNSPELVGKTAVYRSKIKPCSYASYLISVRFSELYVPELASAFINSAHGRRWVKSVVTQQVGQANVNGTKLSALGVPVPPLAEQVEIVGIFRAQLNSSFQQEKDIEKSLNQSAAQRKNLLKSAFSGQLVPQDPNDEPASQLLERIRGERMQQSESSKMRKARSKETHGVLAHRSALP